ncbi:MAG: glycoside hydrolase family 2 TIM barrel-domain containing protein [Victivallaceae bacterium]|nr:glycoside hydrolase family 2 TIM barrel-domain containing protein [Victivallaceae bacterium]
MHEEISLNGDDWKLGRIRPGQGIKEGFNTPDFWSAYRTWLKTSVPGDVHSCLVDTEVIPDPNYGRDNEKNKWVIENEWWYRKSFAIPKAWQGKTVRLLFKGVDYDAVFWLNGEQLGTHQGMFSYIVYDVTKLIKTEALNSLAICLAPPPRNRLNTGGRKNNLSYGIDYSPELITVGIWDEVVMIATGPVCIEDVHITSKLKKTDAELHFDILTVSKLQNCGEVNFSFKITGRNFDSEVYTRQVDKTVKPGKNNLKFDFKLPHPRLWWTHDTGPQNLYEVEISITKDKQPFERVKKTFGIREIKVDKNPGAIPDSWPWTFVINGRRIFIKGSNWTNTDLLLERIKKERYEELLRLVKQANMNMLRIHGWHSREKEAFYDICDREGILIWQEFAFGNAIYPQNEAFLKGVEKECGQVVQILRNHPCLTVWCGGNEFKYHENINLVKRLESVCKAHDPSRHFVPVSDMNRYMYNDRLKGDHHSWAVWFEDVPVENYRQDHSLFISEFGLQAVPVLESLKKFIPSKELWPAGPSWEYHSARLDRIGYYLEDFFGIKQVDSLEQLIELSQRIQAEGLKYAIEHYRRSKYQTSGCMFWSFNDPWPAVSWSVVDWYNRPKMAYEAVKNAYAPVLISLSYAKRKWKRNAKFISEVWIVNDLHQTFPDCNAEIAIIDEPGKVLKKFVIEKISVLPDQAERIDQLEWRIPARGAGNFEVELKLKNDCNSELSTNKYHFHIIQDIGTSYQ